MTGRRKLIARLAARAAVALAALSATPLLAQMAPDATVKSLKLAPGLEATAWAAEPHLVNPTNMDVDSRGRVWVLEGANYRRFNTRPEGDRIVILEDTKGTGVCDSSKVFYQSKDLQSPLGICVLGNKVIVSQSPNVMVFEIDETGDKPKGPPKIVLTGFTGQNHDHGVHSGVFGPDGRFYFNSGNEGTHKLIKDGEGKPIVDSTASELGNDAVKIRGKDKQKGQIGYTDGMAFRCDPDFTHFETLGYNFRNNYELTVDSFGTVWQSDNDDDGNQGVRINYVMEGGNFGYKGPKGNDWKRDQPTFPDQTKQEAHWHLRWPGIVPNLLNTGGGSPTGITVYEGDLLPEAYRGALIHCDAGPNIIRAYVTSPSSSAPTGLMIAGKALDGATDKGAGYKAIPIDLVKGDDKWFRPSDVCVAPDGSLYVADWYDPGVGGHNMQDKNAGEKDPKDWTHLRGRIYRIAPTGNKPTTPKLDLTTVAGQIAGLKSPNGATRYLAYAKLAEGSADANKALHEMYKNDANPRMRARALWLLARSADGKKHVEAALKDKDENIRIAAFRAARLIKMDIPAIATSLLGDESMGLMRELAIAMNYEPADKAVPILVKLADFYDGKDRWYLEAIGIGAIGKEKELLDAWSKDHKNADPAISERLSWRLKKLDPSNKQAAAPKEGRLPFELGGQGETFRALSANINTTDSVMLCVAPASAPAAEVPVELKDKAGKVLPSFESLATLKGDAKSGAAVYRNPQGVNCIRCHQIGDEGGEIGPPLTTIGEKLSRAQLAEAILYPSNSILMGFENWLVKTKDDEAYEGLLTSETAEMITLKDVQGKYIDIPVEKIAKKFQQKISIMPEGLNSAITQQELIDLLEYLATLKNP